MSTAELTSAEGRIALAVVVVLGAPRPGGPALTILACAIPKIYFDLVLIFCYFTSVFK